MNRSRPVVVVGVSEELVLQVLRRRAGAQLREEVGGRHEDQELQLELVAARRLDRGARRALPGRAGQSERGKLSGPP